jgi:hypothetical protein
MRFRGFSSALMMLGAAVIPAAAQAPTPAKSDFDGQYVGTATLSGGATVDACATITSVDMAINDSQAVIHAIRFGEHPETFRGSVNAAAEVSVSRWTRAVRVPTNVDTVLGTISGDGFTAQYRHGRYCYYNVQMQKAALTTTAFDGNYRGVSREVSDNGSNERHCNSRGLTPPRALTITNGIVGIFGEQWWVGTVSAQGVVVLRNTKFTRVDAQIDSQGTIRGQYTGRLPPDVLAQIDGDGTNCILRFVWQRE